MIKCLLSDFSQVILFPKDISFAGSLNGLYAELSGKEYNFFEHYRLNTEILEMYQQFRAEHTLEINIFTSGFVQNDPALQSYLQPLFSHIISAKDIKIEKQDPQAYLKVSEQLNFKPEEIVFIDDQESNIEAAHVAGMKAIRYVSNEQVREELGQILKLHTT